MTTDDADIAGLWNNTAFNTGLKDFPQMKFQGVKITLKIHF